MINVSVIIPLYNAENYIRDCVLSLLAQTLTNFEIIIVNDGSTDGSVAAISDLIEQQEKIHLINKKNNGAAAARNTGLEAAKGKYISFVDHDDWVAPDFLKNRVQICEKHQLDILCSTYQEIHKDGRIYQRQLKSEILQLSTEPYTSGAALYLKQIKAYDYIPMIWSYFYRRGFLEENEFRFTEGVIHEDEDFTPRVLLAAKRANVFESFDYTYHRDRENSVIATRAASSAADLAKMLERFISYNQQLSGEERKVFVYAIRYVLDHYVYYSRIARQMNRQLIKKVVALLEKSQILTLRQRIKYRTVLLSPALYYLLQHWNE